MEKTKAHFIVTVGGEKCMIVKALWVGRDNVLMCIKCQVKFPKDRVHILAVYGGRPDLASQLRLLFVKGAGSERFDGGLVEVAPRQT